MVDTNSNTISGLALPMETVADQRSWWRPGVRPAFPAINGINYGTRYSPGDTATWRWIGQPRLSDALKVVEFRQTTAEHCRYIKS